MKTKNIENTKIVKQDEEITIFVIEKIKYVQEIIRNTILSIQNYKKYEIMTNGDINMCIVKLQELYENTTYILNNRDIHENSKEESEKINTLQNIIDKLSRIICSFGTQNIEDLLFITFGSEYYKNLCLNNIFLESKYEIIKKYFHPTGYKTIPFHSYTTGQKKSESNNLINKEYTNETDHIDHALKIYNNIKPKKQKEKINSNTNSHEVNDIILCQDKMTEEMIELGKCNNIECFDIDSLKKTFYYKIHGLRIIIKSEKYQKIFIVYGIIDDIPIHCITNAYLEKRKEDIMKNIPEDKIFDKEIIKRILDSITIKDILIYGNNDMYKKQINIFSKIQFIKANTIDILIKQFIEMDIVSQRELLIQLLIYNKEDEIYYIVYLLYDLIKINTNEVIDSTEQMLIYDSFPWIIKKYFKESMKLTIKFSHDINSKYDINKITLEQQIFLLKAPENVKDKAFSKLKEIKGKSDDVVSKSKQYLEGLLKIPFGIFKEEPILKNTKHMNEKFKSILNKNKDIVSKYNIVLKNRYTNIEIVQYINSIDTYFEKDVFHKMEKKMEKITNK